MLKVRVQHSVMFYVLCSVTSMYVKLRSSKCITIQHNTTAAVEVALFIVCVHTPRKLKVHNITFFGTSSFNTTNRFIVFVNNIVAITIKFCRIKTTYREDGVKSDIR